MIKKDEQKGGYRLTQLGAIPNEWEIKKIGDVARISGGFAFDSSKFKSAGKYQVVKMSNFYENNLDLERSKSFLTEITEQEKDSLLKDGDIAITLTGTVGKRDYGYSFQITIEKNLLLNQRVAKMVATKIDSNYLFYEIKTQRFLNQFFYSARGGTGNQANVGTTDLLNIKVFLPPFSEQKAIAQILTLMDRCFNKYSELITKKELQKKWLMQNLLTGKKRLLYDKEEIKKNKWITVKLGDVFEFIKTYSISREGLSKANDDNLIYCIHYGDIHAFYENEFLDFSVQQNIPQIIDELQAINERDYLKDGDIIMADASEDYAGVGEVVEVVNLNNKIAVGGLHTIVLRGNNEIITNGFSGYLFSGEVVRNKLRKLATGSSVYSVTKTTLQNLSLIIPGSLKEQTAIADVLRAADKEIQLLKAKRDKLKEKKKGLMQILLTGKKRLKVEN